VGGTPIWLAVRGTRVQEAFFPVRPRDGVGPVIRHGDGPAEAVIGVRIRSKNPGTVAPGGPRPTEEVDGTGVGVLRMRPHDAVGPVTGEGDALAIANRDLGLEGPAGPGPSEDVGRAGPSHRSVGPVTRDGDAVAEVVTVRRVRSRNLGLEGPAGPRAAEDVGGTGRVIAARPHEGVGPVRGDGDLFGEPALRVRVRSRNLLLYGPTGPGAAEDVGGTDPIVRRISRSAFPVRPHEGVGPVTGDGDGRGAEIGIRSRGRNLLLEVPVVPSRNTQIRHVDPTTVRDPHTGTPDMQGLLRVCRPYTNAPTCIVDIGTTFGPW